MKTIIDPSLMPFKPRPHWGKLVTLDPAYVRDRYSKLPELHTLAARFDPNGKFANDFSRLYLF